MSSPPAPLWALNTLRAVAEGLYGRGNVLLTGDRAEKVRSAYYAYWDALGQPSTELHRCMATALYSSEAIRMEFLQPTVAVLMGEMQFIDPVDRTYTSGTDHIEFLPPEVEPAPASDPANEPLTTSSDALRRPKAVWHPWTA